MGSVVAPAKPVLTAGNAERYAELDGHRGIASVAVVIFHVYQFCNVGHFLYYGTPAYTVLNSLDAMVPWFFVITAFVLFEPIARAAITGREPISARGFLTRRALRLLPLYYVVILLVWTCRQHTLPGDWRDLIEHLTFTQVFDGKRIFWTDGPAWSLSVEVFYYLILIAGAIAMAARCRTLPTRKQRITLLTAATAALATVSLTWKAWSFAGAHQPTTGAFTTWFGPLASLDTFAIGMAVAIIAAAYGDRRPLTPLGRLALRLAALAILVIAFATRQAGTWTAAYFSTLCAAGFGALVAAATLGPPRDRIGRILSARPLLWLGTISYSVYLWHEPVLLALAGRGGLIPQTPAAFITDALVVASVSIFAGWLSYHIIERPTSRLGRVFGPDGHLILPAAGTSDDHIEWETFRTGNPL